jgi:hypothetical protein
MEHQLNLSIIAHETMDIQNRRILQIAKALGACPIQHVLLPWPTTKAATTGYYSSIITQLQYPLLPTSSSVACHQDEYQDEYQTCGQNGDLDDHNRHPVFHQPGSFHCCRHRRSAFA